MNADLAHALIRRAGDFCEDGCGLPFGTSIKATRTIDHVQGRGRAEESLATLWVLRNDCHRAKTDNIGGAEVWLRKFIAHCERHWLDATWARHKLLYVLAKKGLSDAARREREEARKAAFS